MPRISAATKKAPPPQVVCVSLRPSEYAKHVATMDEDNIAWRYVHCAGFDIGPDGKRVFHHQHKIPCKCPPGPQEVALTSDADEIALFGGAGSAKTEATFGFLLRGNLRKVGNTPADASYCAHPGYEALVLRKNATDLDDYYRRFADIAKKLGGEAVEIPMRVRFPSGATVYFGHLADPNSYQKYMGKQFTRIVVEEASHIPDELLFVRIKQRNRTKYSREMRCQMMLTMNPNGPGIPWLNKRFRFAHGGPEPWPYGKPFTCPITGVKRLAIHSTAWDNPYFLEEHSQYIQNLESMKAFDEVEYKRMALGDFDVVAGSFFRTFRKVRHPSEPENAVHVIDPCYLAPWWPRAIGFDWGYSHDSGVVVGCWKPNKQLVVYKESKFRNLSTMEAGAHVADLVYKDLQALPSHAMSVYLSHDCFHRDGRESEADQIKRGMEAVLGAGKVFAFAPNDDEMGLSPKEAWESLQARYAAVAKNVALALIPAGGGAKRKHGYTLMREYMRWLPLTGTPVYDERIARHLIETQGVKAYADYKRSIDDAKQEVLPVLQIFSECVNLIQGIQNATEKDGNTEEAAKVDGDDVLDGCVHLVHNFAFRTEELPRDVFIEQRVQQFTSCHQGANTHTLVQVHRAAEAAAREREVGKRITSIPRLASKAKRLLLQRS